MGCVYEVPMKCMLTILEGIARYACLHLGPSGRRKGIFLSMFNLLAIFLFFCSPPSNWFFYEKKTPKIYILGAKILFNQIQTSNKEAETKVKKMPSL